ncbi:hypothetical protein AK812_SmicGene4205 [Symbiodinium microadriaticum]|uniref:Uncharacterized protein n=1 Tax=Symbiodinium microadriaticum TaxID=2951 RepID=A0A1Q9EX52_SYMMI|nr:hypothetical protein AK812_SmicGene4205 [Symbiodinium microadriaticum]
MEKLRSPAAFGPSMTMSQLQGEEPMTAAQLRGMVIGQLLMPYMRNESVDAALLDKTFLPRGALFGLDLEVVRRAEVYKYFGTFNRTLLTMFEVLFANWAIPARVCIENAPWQQSSALENQSPKPLTTLRYVLNQKQKQVEAYAGDGLVSWDEFSVLLSDPQLQLWMSTLDLETQDLVSLPVPQFIDGATRLRGMARSLDVAQVMTSIKKLELKLEANTNPVRALHGFWREPGEQQIYGVLAVGVLRLLI